MKSWLHRRLAPLALLLALSFTTLSGHADVGDRHVQTALDAFRKGDEKKLLSALEQVRGHPLEAYVEYWALRLRLEQISENQVRQFENRWPRSLPQEKLRLDWVKLLGKRRDWATLMQEYSGLEQPDREAQCYWLQARLAQGDGAAAQESLKLWLSGSDLPSACTPLVDNLVLQQRLDVDSVWARLRRTLEQRRLDDAQFTARYLSQAPSAQQLAEVLKAPEQLLNHLPPDFAARRAERELALLALARWARTDPQACARRLESLRDRFSSDERGYVYAHLGWQAAQNHQPQALAWFKAAENAPLNDEQHAWKARAALRAEDWSYLVTTIQAMPVELASKPEWVYWLGRAWKATGRRGDSENQFRKLAGQANFYGNLADEELGRLIDVPPSALPNEREIHAASKEPGVQRALAFYRMDLRYEGAREWNWTLRNAGDRFLLAAAAVAKRESLFDRAISAADRTQGEHDYQMRYLAPYRHQIGPAANTLNLDESWVYGLMRQESRFIIAARSNVGARGLMQVMPSTAKWVAHKLGMKHFRPNDMDDMHTNVLLGTNYMKMVLESLDNQPVLASAAYNAGPRRAKQWRDHRPLEGAIYVETIPFTETRDYVKKVMSNAVFYAALFEKRPQSLKARLGTIQPANNNTLPFPDLP